MRQAVFAAAGSRRRRRLLIERRTEVLAAGHGRPRPNVIKLLYSRHLQMFIIS